ncbi:hypothetical protein BSKO_13918 [Bryopsis sp. KO-2023]|nr:hypothetical protein BSKO_13918 [Bryopsis sp. KO-2023]
MDSEEIIEEECMALEAIFMDSFSKLDDGRIRIVVEPQDESEENKGWSVVLQMKLPDGYPSTIPEFDLSNPSNAAFNASTRDEMVEGLVTEASGQVGEQMVYNLVEWLREKLPEFIQHSRSERVVSSGNQGADEGEESRGGNSKDPKKEKMTKAQKRRHFDRFGAAEDKPRGWNWVEIISHLSKRPQEEGTTST